MKKQHRKAVLAVLLAFVMLFSVLYVVLEADHECSGEDCAVCAQIRACMNLIRNLLPVAAVLTTAGLIDLSAERIGGVLCRVFSSITLISLKIKLSD